MPRLETGNIIAALIALGVEGPAVSIDVLRAAGAYQQLYPDQIAEVLSRMTALMAEREADGGGADG